MITKIKSAPVVVLGLKMVNSYLKYLNIF